MDFDPRDVDSRDEERHGLDRDVGTEAVPTIVTGTTGGNPTAAIASGTMMYERSAEAFVQRHADLLGALPGWTLRLVLPPQLADRAVSMDIVHFLARVVVTPRAAPHRS